MAVVLVVEDEDRVASWLNLIWKNKGAKCSRPERRLALSHFCINCPRSISCFTDLDLKDTHAGIELAKAAVKLRPQLHVLYTTGRAITDGMKARFVPGSATLAKPYTVEEFRDSLSTNFQIDRLRAAHP